MYENRRITNSLKVTALDKLYTGLTPALIKNGSTL